MNNIIFLGCTQNYGYQFSAANTKVEFLAKGLKELGDHCIIHNGITGTTKTYKKEIKQNPEIGFIITYPQKGNRFISWLFNLPLLIKDLKSFYQKKNNNYIILESPDYHIYLVYALLAKIYNYKIIVISHEWAPTITTIHPIKKPFTYLYTYTFGYYANGILPISEFIIKKIEHFKKPYIKIPVIAEYNQITQHKHTKNNNYFLYCVYAAYKRVIYQIIDAYIEYLKNNQTNIKLFLILSGSKKQISIIQDYIEQQGQNTNIIIKNKLPYKTLMDLYSNAVALIIPLDPNNQQDEARFSQKIAEYLSSGTPIISNNVGEIKYYFKDKQNIILCDYNVNGFVNAFKWVSSYPEKARQIGINGFYLGRQEFDYRTVTKKLHTFIQNL